MATVADVCSALERLAPPALAQPWDNVGLLAGDPAAPARLVLLCIDLTPAVVDEAVRRRASLVVAYHPPLFKPVSRLNAASHGTDAAVFRCIARGIAVYSPHTALDAAEGGTNDVLAGLCEIRDPMPVEWAEAPGAAECKMVVFVPEAEADRVAEAIFAAGAGRIGQYSKCSFRLPGQGTFLGSDESNPTIGQAGHFERVDEIRLEVVTPEARVADVLQAIRAAHSYEEPAIDVYPLKPPVVAGMGRQGRLDPPIPLGALADRLKRALAANTVQMVGDSKAVVSRAVCLVGAAGSSVFQAGLRPGDVVVTGEIRHHDALAVRRYGACAIALNHWTSERPVLRPLADRLAVAVPGLQVDLSDADAEPFTSA
ncbi:MAG: Nif3-like dinuclear metal center hexameric protein [Phycisphaerae bacterium]|nr:Nif3-like dinuclear metal center hexameric protein [Phycisphaerae bacterium]